MSESRIPIGWWTGYSSHGCLLPGPAIGTPAHVYECPDCAARWTWEPNLDHPEAGEVPDLAAFAGEVEKFAADAGMMNP